MEKNLRLWFDKEGDILEFTIRNTEGFFTPSNRDDDIWIRLDAKTREPIGFMILNFSKSFGTAPKWKKLSIPFDVEFKKLRI